MFIYGPSSIKNILIWKFIPHFVQIDNVMSEEKIFKIKNIKKSKIKCQKCNKVIVAKHIKTKIRPQIDLNMLNTYVRIWLNLTVLFSLSETRIKYTPSLPSLKS